MRYPIPSGTTFMGILITILAALFAVLVGWLALRPAAVLAESSSTVKVVHAEGAEKSATSREALAERLQALPSQPAPKDLKPGAMCYEVAEPPRRAEYVCPVCKEKTLYALPVEGQKGAGEAVVDLPQAVSAINQDLPACRRLIKEIKGLPAELDESQFCRKCRPEAKAPRLGLVIRYAGQAEPHRVWGVTGDDLRLLAEFLDGKAKHVGVADAESPMKDHLKRLEELLGVKVK